MGLGASMRAVATVRLPDGRLQELTHGDLIGRSPSAALLLDDPRISEAHAIVSLRHGGLYLLALRRLLVAGGKPTSELRLVASTRVDLVDDLAIDVVGVETPSHVLGIQGSSIGCRILPQVASVLAGPPPRVVGRFVPDAPVHLWATGDRWRMRRHGEQTHELSPGASFELAGERFELTAVPIADAGAVSTHATGATAAPIRIVAFYDTVQIHRRGREVFTLGGTGARIVSELIACAGPLAWDVIAREVWPDDVDDPGLRHRWDVALGRLRTRLREAGIRDLLRADGNGQVVLELYDGDEVDDRT
ncbi:MAG: hypothetical protein AB7O24_22885 [Kofleriaceae bacterium]